MPQPNLGILAAAVGNALLPGAPAVIMAVADVLLGHPDVDDAAKREISDALQAEGHDILARLRAKDTLGQAEPHPIDKVLADDGRNAP